MLRRVIHTSIEARRLLGNRLVVVDHAPLPVAADEHCGRAEPQQAET
jgi:hypothetical protein